LCGKKTDKLIEGYCTDCYKKEKESLKIPEKFSFTVCSKCKRFKINNKWKWKEIMNLVREKADLKSDVRLSLEKYNNTNYIFVADSGKGRKYEIRVHLNRIMCPDCTRRHGGYYEAILQVRGDEELIDEKVIDFIENKFLELEKSDKRAFFRVKETKGGLDFYIGSKAAANKVSKLLKMRFGADIKKSFKLYGKKEGRNVYRNVISARI
jgi:nonsense-mediated mRNA decay protein 3